MKFAICLGTVWAVFALGPAGKAGEFGAEQVPEVYGAPVARILQAATNSTRAYDRLAEMCDRFGPRFSGSTNLEAAIDWVLEEMRTDGLENVRGEDVEVPHWVRGEEGAELVRPRPVNLPMLGLGGSIGTPEGGITAELVVVGSFAELKELGERVAGKMVLYNVPYTDYRETVAIRVAGAVEAAKRGAVASLIRSVGPFSMQTPHTGGMRYEEGVPKIPHAALTIEDAMMLQRMQDRGEEIVVRLRMSARTLAPATSRNVIAELRGREKPEEIVLIGAHIDSWDVGQGAMDDGGGCAVVWEAARLLKELDLRPRRTVRVVLFTNEENGLAGARAYRELHREELGQHVVALESDGGTFEPTGFSFTGSERAMPYLRAIAELFKPVGATDVGWGAGGADVRQLVEEGVPIMDLVVDRTRYFWFHHTWADTVDKLDSGEMNRCVGAVAGLVYVIADMPERLPY